jgi:hypothetical protein
LNLISANGATIDLLVCDGASSTALSSTTSTLEVDRFVLAS